MPVSRISVTAITVGAQDPKTKKVTVTYEIEISNNPGKDQYPVPADVSFYAYDSTNTGPKPTPVVITPSPKHVTVSVPYDAGDPKHCVSAAQTVTVDCSTAKTNPCYLIISPTDKVGDESTPASVKLTT
jgi:hypothetical protein